MLTLQADAATTRTFEQIEQRLVDTWLAGDCDGWSALLDPAWSVIHITGATITRGEALEICRAPRHGDKQTVDDVKVRLYGDTAIVTGRTTVTSGETGQVVQLRFTDVCVRRDGRWRIVASQATRVPS